MRPWAVMTIWLVLLPIGALAQGVLPDPVRVPGALNPMVTPETIGETICVRGWTRSVRPPVGFSEAVKRQLVRGLLVGDRHLGAWELDHLVPLELGGSPDDPRNLWLEPRETEDGWGADKKDELESVLNHLVCAGRLPLAEAQSMIATDWVATYRRYLGEPATE